MGGDYMHIEIRNRHGYRLASGDPVSVSSSNAESDEAADYDWEAELDRTLLDALRTEARREARRLPTRLRRALSALQGSVASRL